MAELVYAVIVYSSGSAIDPGLPSGGGWSMKKHSFFTEELRAKKSFDNAVKQNPGLPVYLLRSVKLAIAEAGPVSSYDINANGEIIPQ